MDKTMQPYLEEMLGKTIHAVIVKEREKGTPNSQIFLVFDDGSFFEFYSMSDNILAAKGVKHGTLADVRKYMDATCSNVLEAAIDKESPNDNIELD